MPNNIAKLLILFLAVVIVSGCQTPSVKIPSLDVSTYAKDEPRLDQNISGNAGYIVGPPNVEDRSAYKSTRRIYVLEVNKKEDESADIKKVVEETIIKNQDEVKMKFKEPKRVQVKTVPEINLGDLNQGNVYVAPKEEIVQKQKTVKLVDYLVEKDDTLQKISKKFYDSYSKWPRIYEENKKLISNPDFLKPGITIKIPIEE